MHPTGGGIGRPVARRPRPSGATFFTMAVLAVAAAVGIFLVVLSLARNPNVKTQLGQPQFEAGRARDLFVEITKPGPDGRQGPLLFQDLLGHARDIYLQHLGGDPLQGWLAFEAHAPAQPRTCVLQWRQRQAAFRDPCGGALYPADGTGLIRYAVTVNSAARVVVNLQRPQNPSAP